MDIHLSAEVVIFFMDTHTYQQTVDKISAKPV